MSAAAAAAKPVEAFGLALAVRESGDGPSVLLVHGPGIGASIWDETVAELHGAVRAIAYDRRAYGDSESPEPYGGTTVEEQAEDAAVLIDSLGAAPAVVCGHDLGALVALDLVRRHRDLVRAAVVIEPPLLWLSPRGPDALGRLREAIALRVRETGPSGAVDAYLEQMAGDDFAERLGPERLAGARAVARAMAADLGAGPAWAMSPDELRRLEAPVTVMTGARTAPARREVGEALAGLLPRGTFREADAGHLVPLDDPRAIAAAVREAAG